MNKPKFDPSKPFDVAQEEKPKFDPSKSFQSVGDDHDDGFNSEAALRGFGDSALLGYADNIRAATEPLTFGVLNALTGNDVESDGDYVSRRDAEHKRTEQLKEENPGSYYSGMAGGALASSLLVPGGAAAEGASAGARIANAAKVGGTMGLLANPGDKEGELSGLQLGDRADNAGKGILLGGGLQAAGEGVSAAAKAVPKALKSFAEKAAVNATGATGKQASEFADNAGRELLDRGIVKFGDSQAQIAKRASQAVEKANSQIDQALTKLDDAGVNVDTDKIRSQIADKIQQYSEDPSKSDIVKHLQNELDNLDLASEARSSTEVGIQDAEKIKRGYNRKAGNWMDPEKGQAGKEMYQAYRGSVEDQARNFDPEIAKLFEEGKKSYGLLSPIEEAAQRRALTTSQSPPGGLLDVASAAGGAVSGDPSGGILTAVGRRMLSPRISSSAAVGADALASKLASISPKFAEMAQKNPQAFALMVDNLSRSSKFERSNQPAPRPEAPKLPIMDRLSDDPNGINVLQNDRLKKHLEEYKKTHQLKNGVPLKEAQNQFIDGN